jgi:DNA polymerase III subunit epsilon
VLEKGACPLPLELGRSVMWPFLGRGTMPASLSSQRLVGLSYAVVDVETTGGSPWMGHRVTEIAAVIVRDGRIAESYETLVNPERSIPPFVMRLTHITPSMVRDKPPFASIAPEVADFLHGHVFVAHNAAFDRRFVEAEVQRAGCSWKGDRTLCTVRLARGLVPHLRRRSLDHLAFHYGVRITNRHRAMGDAMATAHCFVRLLDDAGARGLDTWEDVAKLTTRPRGRGRRHRPPALPQLGEWELGA